MESETQEINFNLDHFNHQNESEKFNEAVAILSSLLDEEDIYTVEKAFAIATAKHYYKSFLRKKDVREVPPNEYQSYAQKFFKEYDVDKYHTQSPPANEHAKLFRKDNEPKLYLSQPYQIEHDVLAKMLEFSTKNDLEITISNDFSFWYPSQSLTVEYKKS